MPNKLQAYAEQAERTARQITGSHLAWTAFLTTAARLYKYPYNEQLMIYMQRPEATACAEYDFWNEKMGAMSGAAARASPSLTLPATSQGSNTSLTFPIPAARKTPAASTCGS